MGNEFVWLGWPTKSMNIDPPQTRWFHSTSASSIDRDIHFNPFVQQKRERRGRHVPNLSPRNAGRRELTQVWKWLPESPTSSLHLSLWVQYFNKKTNESLKQLGCRLLCSFEIKCKVHVANTVLWLDVKLVTCVRLQPQGQLHYIDLDAYKDHTEISLVHKGFGFISFPGFELCRRQNDPQICPLCRASWKSSDIVVKGWVELGNN